MRFTKILTRLFLSCLFLFFIVNVPAKNIHLTKIITPGDLSTKVYIWLKVGHEKNGICKWEYILQPNPSMELKTGDSVPVDDEQIKKVGLGYTCGSINFQINEDHPVTSDYFLITVSKENGDYLGTSPYETTQRIQ